MRPIYVLLMALGFQIFGAQDAEARRAGGQVIQRASNL